MEMPEISRARTLAYVAVVLALLVVGGRFLALGSRGSERPAGDAPRAALEAEPVEKPKLVVHVVGAVANPGLYRLTDGSRVDDAIRSAGGAKPKAALDLVNLAAPVADGQQIVVPLRSPGGPVATTGGAAAGSTSAGGPVHLNTATVEQLDALPGVGPVTAQKIVDYREEKGAFTSVEELDAVPGIGPARLAQLKELVQL